CQWRSSETMPAGPAYKAFVSSTFVDLKDHRARVISTLRKSGIHVDPMEDWGADAREPACFCRGRLEGCQRCVLLVAFRPGFVAEGEALSITQLEYEHARESGIDVLPFLLDDEAAWPRRFDDMDRDPAVRAWRDQLRQRHGVGTFGLAPESLDVGPAVMRWLRERAPEAPSPGAAPFDFTAYLESKRRHFVGREWLFDEIEHWRQRRRERALLVVGDPGIGKSALVAELVHRNP